MTRLHRRKTKKGPYLVMEYICTRCHHIFHTARSQILIRCNSCGGKLEVLGQNKSKFTPGVSRKKPGGKWVIPSEFFYDRVREHERKSLNLNSRKPQKVW